MQVNEGINLGENAINNILGQRQVLEHAFNIDFLYHFKYLAVITFGQYEFINVLLTFDVRTGSKQTFSDTSTFERKTERD